MASKKRSRKDKNVGSSSAAALSDSERFIDHDALVKFSSYNLKLIKNGRVVDNDSNLNGNGLNVYTLLYHQGLDKFLATNIGVYPLLVKEFYANLRHPYDNRGKMDHTRLITRVHGKDISFDEGELGLALELDSFDDQLNITKFSDIPTIDPNCNLLDALNTICHTPQTHTSNIRALHLKLPCHIIHRILVHSINPRSGSYDQVPKFDIYLVWAIYTQKRINWASFLFSLFKNGAKRKDANLVLGIGLSKLFHYYNCVEGADLVKLTTDDYFTETTIQRFGYAIVNDTWVRKGGATAQDEPELYDDPFDQDDDEAMHTQPPSSSQSNPTNFELMQAIQEARLESRQDAYDIRQDMNFLRHDMRQMNFNLTSLRGAFQAQWPDYVFPPPPPEDAE